MNRDEHRVPLLGAHVAGWPAFVIDCILRAKAEPYLRAMNPEQRREVEPVLRLVHLAALTWQQASTSVDGNAETPSAAITGRSEGEIDTAAVAVALDITERRVRQLAAGWAEVGLARKVRRSWVIDREAIRLHEHTTTRKSA